MRNKTKTPDHAAQEMSFLDHLEELRWRIIKSLIAVVVTAIPCAVFWRRIFTLLMIYPLRYVQPAPKIIYTAPAEAVMLSLKIALAGGLILGAPVIFYQVWCFVSPGLHRHERRLIIPIVIFSTLSFFLGISFSYLVIPYIIKFLSTFGGGVIDPYFKAQEYVLFIIKLSLAFGVVFELPILSYILARNGIITHRFLVKHMRYFIVIAFIASALLTPPDLISQVFLVAPLLLLYGLSIFIAWAAARRSP